ncbi:glycosyltransferase [Alteromonas pelagimontana]|uniref:Glycosyltransferase n=1 Tax=Alteromonas pelagimontana TaxID=1858656 RepID=A0A6M4MBH5_9ALTE|nr:glycosyltransferase [Alteromonas pelagimontana]QJR80158.1 glycosyltransferase [Alteromonas pelagimontana]
MAKNALRVLFWLNLILVAALVTYKIYLNFFERDFAAEHAFQVENIEERLNGKSNYRFAVVGNVSNSVGIFERKIIPQLNRGNYDFVVSAGNAVSSGGEDKYRAIYRTLSRLKMPYLLAFGPQEESRIGGYRFYDHFGPLHFSFPAGNSRFIFLDSTGTTDFGWQYRWLEEDLDAADEANLILFSAHPFYPVDLSQLFELNKNYLFNDSDRLRFTQLIESTGVDAVFSANLPRYELQQHEETQYVVTGGAGGLVINNEQSHYHFVAVTVEGDTITIEEKRIDSGQHPVWRTLESFWFFVHSLFYVGYLNFILLISGFAVIATWLYNRVFTERNYYPDFDNDPDALNGRLLRIAMFTNNYLPYVGGVPISIDRLRQGLSKLGHKVLIVAPSYAKNEKKERLVFRVRALLPLKKKSQFRLGNVFSVRTFRRIYRFRPDIIHVHHPFWLGKLGLIIGNWLNVPVIYTYHTRLEHYAHYVPLPGPLFRNLVSHTIVRRFANRCDGVVVPTESAEEYLRAIGVRKRILVQPTGIDYQAYQNVSEDAIASLKAKYAPNGERILVSISRLSQEKNLGFLLKAIRQLQEQAEQPFRLLIIGDGPVRNHLEATIKKMELTSSVILIGAVPPDEIPAYCRLGDIFLFASRSETQGMVILEAMAAGMPVVAVRSSGIDDIVENGYNGFKTKVDKVEWASRIEQLLSDTSLYEKLSTNAKNFAVGFSINHFSININKFYGSVLCSKKKSK